MSNDINVIDKNIARVISEKSIDLQPNVGIKNIRLSSQPDDNGLKGLDLRETSPLDKKHRSQPSASRPSGSEEHRSEKQRHSHINERRRVVVNDIDGDKDDGDGIDDADFEALMNEEKTLSRDKFNNDNPVDEEPDLPVLSKQKQKSRPRQNFEGRGSSSRKPEG